MHRRDKGTLNCVPVHLWLEIKKDRTLDIRGRNKIMWCFDESFSTTQFRGIPRRGAGNHELLLNLTGTIILLIPCCWIDAGKDVRVGAADQPGLDTSASCKNNMVRESVQEEISWYKEQETKHQVAWVTPIYDNRWCCHALKLHPSAKQRLSF